MTAEIIQLDLHRPLASIDRPSPAMLRWMRGANPKSGYVPTRREDHSCIGNSKVYSACEWRGWVRCVRGTVYHQAQGLAAAAVTEHWYITEEGRRIVARMVNA